MEQLNISLVQIDLHWENSKKNMEQIDILLKKENPSTDLILLPEMFNTAFSMNSKALAQKMDGDLVEQMKNWAQQYDSAVVGSFICEENEHYYNRLLFVEPNGKIQTYNKRHLFRMANENQYFSMGHKRLIVTYKSWKIMPLVCYDLRFPVWSRNQFQTNRKDVCDAEYDLMLYIANWPKARVNAWDKLLLARAIENQAYVAAVNRVGKDGNEIEYNGHSCLIDAKGEYLVQPIENKECIISYRISKSELEEFRKKFPLGMDRDSFKIY